MKVSIDQHLARKFCSLTTLKPNKGFLYQTQLSHLTEIKKFHGLMQ